MLKYHASHNMTQYVNFQSLFVNCEQKYHNVQISKIYQNVLNVTVDLVRCQTLSHGDI